MISVIGLGGRLRSGKDVVADHLVERYGFEKMGMSDPLSDALAAINPIVEPVHHVRYADLLERVGYTQAKRNPEVRRLLQVLGTEVGRRMIGENVWVEIAERRITDSLVASDRRNERGGVAITGIRFPNELRMIQDLGGLTAWVERPSAEAVNRHDSETSVGRDDFDVVLHNDGTIADLHSQVDDLLWLERAVAA